MGEKRQAIGSVVSVAGGTDTSSPSDWLIEENEFGGPMVEHKHSDGRHIAYVLLGRTGDEFAQCASCGERVALGA